MKDPVIASKTPLTSQVRTEKIVVSWHPLLDQYVAVLDDRDVAGSGGTEEEAILDLLAKLKGDHSERSTKEPPEGC
jgi:hypothetical protein